MSVLSRHKTAISRLNYYLVNLAAALLFFILSVVGAITLISYVIDSWLAEDSIRQHTSQEYKNDTRP